MDLHEQLEGYRRELMWKDKDWNEEKQAYEMERDRLKAELKLSFDQKVSVEQERDHFKNEADYMGKEKDKFWKQVMECEDKLMTFKKVKGDLIKI